MKRWFARAIWVLTLALLVARPVLAQAEGRLELKLNRDFGYGGFGEIQGLFSLKASGPEGLVHVDFTIDDQSIGEASQAPFQIQFHTDNFSPGPHTLGAVGTLADGGTVRSNEIRVTFLSKDAAGKATAKVIVPLVGIVVLIVVAAAAMTLLAARRRGPVPLGQPRKYGVGGGTICGKCGRPFALPVLGLNLVVGKLAVCPHCGRWSVARSVPLAALRAAEAAELAGSEGAPQVTGPDEEEMLRRAIDESRYQE